jgi:hypothetical protein
MSGSVAPSPDVLFEGAPKTERANKFLAFRDAVEARMTERLLQKMRKEIYFVRASDTGFDPQAQIGIVKSAQARFADDFALAESTMIAKGVSAEQIASVRSALAGADLGKEWTLSNPLSVVPFGDQGLVPYDLSPVLQMIVPRELKLRNVTPRIKGMGTAYNFRSITGVSGSASGGVANIQTFFSSASTTQTVGGINWNRPPAISYAATSQTVVYAEEGTSDSVTMQADYAGQGYTSLRSLSATANLWSGLLGQERNFLGGVNTALSIVGITATVEADSTVTTTLPDTDATTTVITFTSAAVVNGFLGESKGFVPTGDATAWNFQGIKISALSSVPAGTIAINIYTEVSGQWYKGTTPFTIPGAYGVGASPGTFVEVAAGPSTAADNGSFSALAYQGYISAFSTPDFGGYQEYVNAAVTLDLFDEANVTLYESIQADPDVIWTTPSIRSAFGDALETAGVSSSTGIRVNYDGGEGVIVGNFVTGVKNKATGKVIDLQTHRYMPAGVALLHSYSVPFPDSGVSNTVEYHAPIDFVSLEWPVTDLNYSISNYSYGALAFRAPAFSAFLGSIND